MEEKYNKNPSYKKTTFKSIMEKPKKFYYFFNLLNNIINDKSEISFKFLFKQNEEHTEYIFEIYCIDASYGMKNLLTIKPYSIILTSGTLFIGSLETLLGVKFKEKLNNKHVIDNSQFLAYIISSIKILHHRYKFKFNYQKRYSERRIKFLGKEIYNLVNSVKIGGVLVFFSSYDYLNQCKDIWDKYKMIEKFKKLMFLI